MNLIYTFKFNCFVDLIQFMLIKTGNFVRQNNFLACLAQELD